MRAVDLFAGWGGFSLGGEAAGLDVVYAANHWPTAVAVHAANHPATRHECQDLRQADWTRLPAYDVLLASPCCQPHSRAGRVNKRWGTEHQARHDADRATAWAVVDCADATEPKVVVVENVPAFRAWRLYPVWRAALEALGYELQEHVVVASRHGHTPQRRERLFVIGVHGRARAVAFEEHAEPAFGPCIDWNEGEWRDVSLASPGAQARFARARSKIGDRALVQHVSRGGLVPLHEPIRTITTKDQWAVLDGDRYRPLTTREYARAMGFPDSYKWPGTLSRADVIRGLGNAVPPELARRACQAGMEAVA